MTHENVRKIWARGVTPREHGRIIRFADGSQGLLRSHTTNQDGTTTLNIVMGVTLANNQEVTVVE